MTAYESVVAILLAVFIVAPALASLFGRPVYEYAEQERSGKGGGE